MTSIIWGAFGLTLILIVVIGAMIQYIKDREKYKKTEDDDWNKIRDMVVVIPETPAISEPVTSFIKCFKDNPKRFKLSKGAGPLYTFKDNVTKKSWEFMVRNEGNYEAKDSWHVRWVYSKELYLIGVGCQWITKEERSALYLAMYPYFVTERRDRLHAIQRERLTRIYKEKGDV